MNRAVGILGGNLLVAGRADEDFKRVKDYLLEFPIYKPKGIETCLKSAKIYRKCRKIGKAIRKTINCIIAVICIENNLTLLHKDGDSDIIEGCIR
ncbi:MAG TPA: PIN domain nuclease [Synergistaceae bacterium]|nr:PIN domain nuclease [Synergistaceae bacterium]